MSTRCTAAQSSRAGRFRRIKGIESATLIVAILAATAAQADTISGTVNTGGNPANFSGDTVTFAGAPSNGPFPLQMTVGEFDFTVPSGQVITAGLFSGNFGSNILGSATSQARLFLDGVELALCDAACEAASQSNDVPWQYSLTASDLALLSTNSFWLAGRAILTASQLSASQVVLEPTSVSLTTSPVPIPAAVFLFTSALAPLFGFAGLKARGLIRGEMDK
jgi:hypothetical protein